MSDSTAPRAERVELGYRDEGNSLVSVDPTQPLPVRDYGAGRGAPAFYTNQVALAATPKPLLNARSSRRRVVVKNHDASIIIYVGPTSAVSSSTGFEVKAGESVALYTTAAVWAIAASGTPTAGYVEEYD